MVLVFDTSVLIAIEKGNRDIIKAVDKLSKEHSEKPCIPSLVFSEFFIGGFGQSISDQVKMITALKKYNVLNTTFSSSILLANIDRALAKKGKKIPLFDIIIASIAIDNDLTLVTMDNHFNRIPGLDVLYIGK